ncbi:MAG: ribonuclease J, partial [Candidatus Riflemargulisbacteria bacterium]
MVKLSIFGGLDGIGMNMMSFQHGNELIIIDAGIMFPDADLHGVDKIIPSFSYFEEHQKDIKAIFLTHGHEDHIGAVAHFIEKINVPIYGTKLTLGMVEHKLIEAGLKKYKLVEINEKSVIKFKHFRLEFIRVSHSIPDGVMTVIHSPVGVIVHSGDFKIDYTPVDGKVVDLKRIANIGNKGVILFMSDSTNAVKKGHTQSEKHVGDAFEQEFAGVSGRLLVATFSSNIHRLQQAINVGKKFGRKICFVGKSMENTSSIARRLGYIEFDDEDIISMNDVDNYPDNQILVLVTGSQGEPLAALSRMANDKHPF